MLNIEDFWADGSSASRQLLSRLEDKKREEREAYLKTWEGKRALEDKQRNAIAAYVAGWRINELGQ